MSPDHINTAVNAAAWAHAQVGTYGPGLAVAAAIWAAARTIRALHAATRTLAALYARRTNISAIEGIEHLEAHLAELWQQLHNETREEER